MGATSARAQPPESPEESLAATADLDGLVVAAGPLGSAVRLDGDWAGAFGGEISLVRLRERSRLVALGGSVGGVRLAGRNAGLLFADLSAATRGPWGVPVGASVGGVLALEELALPRLGAQGTLWLFLGVIPYARAGWVDGSGVLIEAGLKIALPVVRWK